MSNQPHKRGRHFEKVVAEIFDRGGFDVVTNPQAAHPRQTDVYASRGAENYLIEAKWRSAVVGCSDIDDIRVRLQRQPGSVIGVLVTMGDVADEALREIERDRRMPVLVIDDRETEALVAGTADLRRLLRSKHTQLTVHGRASGLPANSFVASRRDQREPLQIVGVDGSQQPWLCGTGSFYDNVWALNLPDIDWIAAGGVGVSLDLPVRVHSLEDVLTICKELTAFNWLTHEAAWVLQQSPLSWNGVGRESMLAALNQRAARYAGLTGLHHREVLVISDECPGGWYTLVADLDARSQRAHHVDISLQLIGVPADPSEIQRLCGRIGVVDVGYFRPRIEKSVESFRLSERVEVSPAAWVVEHEPDDPHNPLWARGIVFTNPIVAQGTGLPIPLENDGVVIAHLRSWHPANEPPSTYFLERFEWARSSDATVMRAIADWPEEARAIDRAPLQHSDRTRPAQ